MAQTGHKSESSIHAYNKKVSTQKRREMSECLASNLLPKKKPAPAPTATVSVPSENQRDKFLTINSDWFELDPTDDNLDDTHLLDIINNIEKETSQLVPTNQQNNLQKDQTTTMTPMTSQNTTNFSAVSNIQKAPILPGMYFPNSTVTKNYNIINPK